MDNCKISDDEEEEAGARCTAFYAERLEKRRMKRRAARQFIDSMASVEGESKIDWEDEEDASSTASDDSFIVGYDIFD